MRIGIKYPKVKFEEAVKEFNFTQFYEICKIFNVDVVDRKVFDELTAEAKEQAKEIDLSKVKMRRDFDVMTTELVEAYNKLPRRNRRQIDPVIAKIVWGNKKARKIDEKRIVDSYNEGLEQLPTVMAAEASDGEQ